MVLPVAWSYPSGIVLPAAIAWPSAIVELLALRALLYGFDCELFSHESSKKL